MSVVNETDDHDSAYQDHNRCQPCLNHAVHPPLPLFENYVMNNSPYTWYQRRILRNRGQQHHWQSQASRLGLDPASPNTKPLGLRHCWDVSQPCHCLSLGGPTRIAGAAGLSITHRIARLAASGRTARSM
jgi:hypothetical protein